MVKNKLNTVNDSANSFYGKAKVIEYEGGTKILESYKTKVVKLAKNGTIKRLWDGYSMTTLRHVNEFLAQNGINKKLTKKDWMEMEVSK